jgi:hypothetical protein
MDLAFKMVQGITKVFTISGWNEQAKSKIIFGVLHMRTICVLYANPILTRVEHLCLCFHESRNSSCLSNSF